MTNDAEPVNRFTLPIPDPVHVGVTTYDAKDPDTFFPPVQPVRPPAGAPNVLLILLDDVGFGASSAFGGPCRTPATERLAASGLKLTRFHTTALCAPSRAALLTGRNHHSVGMGSVPDLATAAPGNNSVRPKAAAPLAEVLKLNGYATAQFGKCHEVPMWQASPAGPFDLWPTGSGFEYFYGFIGGGTNQWYPALYEGTTPVDPPASPDDGYHLTEDLADRAIAWIRQQKSLTPGKPFFVYFAPGATHAPHHVPREWIEANRGRFDAGWDVLREEIFARQKELGVIPPDAVLTGRPAEIPAWDDMPAELRGVLARQMEVFAAYLEHTDHQVGRLLDAVAELGILDETLTVHIVGDNGASAEGTPRGTTNELLVFNQAADVETADYLREHIDALGSPEANNHYAVGWAHATCTPYQWTKQVASHFGGTRNGAIVHWPAGFAASGQTRTQFCHLIDVAPTILDAADLPAPAFVHGIQQMPLHGTSMRYFFDDPDAPERHQTQYFEIMCNRGIYHRGWTAVTRHSLPWVAAQMPVFDDDTWELYDTATDWTQARDLAAEHPDKLRDLQRLFLIEAVKYGALPLDDRRAERFLAELAGRPQLVTGHTQLLFGGMDRLSESSVIDVKNISHSVTADVMVRGQASSGVLIAQGGAFGGWSLYLREGKPCYCYNLLGITRTYLRADAPVPAGHRQVRFEFSYTDAHALGGPATVALYVDGEPAGVAQLDRTTPLIFSYDETTDVGRDSGSGVSEDYGADDNAFPGVINWVQIDTGKADNRHLISPEDRWRVAMARQ
jgi:arylsulfatase A-like enzyme